MKRLLLFGLLLLAKWATAQDIPQPANPPRLVNDFAHVLSEDQYTTLESKLQAYNDSTSSQIAIVTVDSLNGAEPEEYALKIMRTWGVGSKKNNNGIVILASIKDHKLRIEVGKGLEGAITDLLSKEIIENDLAPNFRAGNYYRGFDRATDDILKAAAGEYKADENAPSQRGHSSNGGNLLGIIIVIIIIIVVLARINGGGGGGGGTFNRGGFLPGLIIGSLLNRGGGGGWGGGGGGGWSGGGGDSGGGGGFGGFGGGSGDGGGASGSW